MVPQGPCQADLPPTNAGERRRFPCRGQKVRSLTTVSFSNDHSGWRLGPGGPATAHEKSSSSDLKGDSYRLHGKDLDARPARTTPLG
jgi:hypothetical protein